MRAGYFLLGDSLNTTVTVIGTLQNSIVSYDSLTLTYLLLVGIAAQAVGIYAFWYVQRTFRLSVKTMFNAVMIGIILLYVHFRKSPAFSPMFSPLYSLPVQSILPNPPTLQRKPTHARTHSLTHRSDGWGMTGIWTQTFGFHHVWEVWLYQAFYDLFVCPWYSYSQIMISEITPRGHEFLFFSLFSIVGKTSSFIGPLVSSAIIDATPSGNVSTPFYFLFGLSGLSFLLLVVFVDLRKSRREQERFLLEKEEKVRRRERTVA